MKQHVLLASIGPVQEFISSARKCRDLWFGSWILSELSRAAALGMVEKLEENESSESIDDSLRWMVFPGAANRASLEKPDTSIANRILLYFAGTEELVRDVAETGRSTMKKRLDELRDVAFARVGGRDPERERHFHEDTARQQIDDLIEYQWVAVAEEDGPEGYVRARREAERLLSARKNTKIWGQPPWSRPGVPKSSLDGVRESVLDESLFDKISSSTNQDFWRIAYGIHGSERLCGVGLLKRKGIRLDAAGREIERFMSTSHLAALPLITGIETEDPCPQALVGALKDLCDELGEEIRHEEFQTGLRKSVFFGDLDGAVLFEGRITRALEARGAESLKNKCVDSLRRLLRIARRGEPIPYYAILLADGDRMGAVIDAQTTADEHRKLSTALEVFARDARCIVEESCGSLIYSGGDDVLALLPLHEALGCAERLADTFRDRMKKWTNREGQTATLSAGLAIVHHLMPLGEALDLARQAESRAKLDAGRDALAIILHKRGGTPLSIHGHWAGFLSGLFELINFHRAEEIPARAGHELKVLDRLSENADESLSAVLGAVQRAEMGRILARKRAEHGNRAVQGEVLGRIRDLLEDNKITPAEVGKQMVIAGFFAQALTQAGSKGPIQAGGKEVQS